MKLIITVALVAITSTSYGAFSLEDYKAAKAKQGNPVMDAPKISEIITDYALGVRKNETRITTAELELVQLEKARDRHLSALRSLEAILKRSTDGMASAKKANKPKPGVISTGSSYLRSFAAKIARETAAVKAEKKGLSKTALRIKNARRTISTSRQKIVLYTHKLAQEKESAGAAV